MLEKIPEARLIVVGDGYLRGRFLRFIESNRLGEYITHIAGAWDVRPYLSKAWVLRAPFEVGRIFQVQCSRRSVDGARRLLSPGPEALWNRFEDGVTGLHFPAPIP